MKTPAITPVSDMILALRNGLVMYWALAVKLDPDHLMKTYSQYCIALDALDSGLPGAVTTLEQAVPIFHAAIKMLDPNQAATS